MPELSDYYITFLLTLLISLGHIIEQDGIRVDLVKISAISNMEQPHVCKIS